MQKTIYTSTFIIAIAIIVAGFVIGGGSAQSLVGGTSHMGSLALSGNLAVDGTVTQTGASAFTGAITAGTVDVSNFTQGGGVLNIGISGTATITPTLTQAQMAAYNYLQITASTTATTTIVTLPATSTLTTLLPVAGDSKSWIIENANAAAGAVTITAGAGIELIAVTANDDVIDGLEYAQLDCYRKATGGNVVCVTSELLAAD